ncbi:hypothetical protein HN385_03455 [archaeon]|jgi:hypothetical protein|nr:hypothetical protein [archaeon]MBT3450688.1 hypothetical protein [archaeon]MBT6869753.1 hypothetical protein [archaeon]MBT7192708.1 hypothetical protein [archaeon]MBT7380733.1 hypothetical protein [archaeon]
MNLENLMIETFEELGTSTLNSVLDSYHSFITKCKDIRRNEKNVVPGEIFLSLRKSVTKNKNHDEIKKLCGFYSSCVEISGIKFIMGATRVNSFLSNDLMYIFDDYAKTHLCLENDEMDRSLFWTIKNLANEKRGDILLDLFDYLRDFKDHPLFNRSCSFLENNSSFEDIFKSYLIKLPGFMQPRSKFNSEIGFIEHHEFNKLTDFNNHYLRELKDEELKYEIDYNEMFLLQETEELVSNYCTVLEEYGDSVFPIGFGASKKLFFQYLNESISCGETLEDKHKSMTSWCEEVQRMIKSGAYDDELRLMFGSFELVGGGWR